MTRDAPVEERLDELESHVERQQQTLADQRATIAAQRDRIERLEDDRQTTERNEAADDDGRSNTEPSPSRVSRRGVLQGLGLAGLVGLGAGTANADEPRGVVGSGDHPVDTLYLDTLAGSLTGGADLTTVTGDGLSIEDGALGTDSSGPTVSDFGQVVAEDVDRLSFEDNLDVREGDEGIEVTASDSNTKTDVSNDGTTVVGSTSDIDFGDNLAVTDDGDGSATVDAGVQAATSWEDAGSNLLTTSTPFTGINVDDLEVGSLDLTGSTTIDHADLDGHGEDDHHTKDHDHTEGDVSTVPNAGLSNSSVTVTPGNGLGNGGSVPLGGSVTLDVEADGIGTSELNTPFSNLDVLFERVSSFSELFIPTGGVGIDLNGGVIRNQGRISDITGLLSAEGFTFYQSDGSADVIGDVGDVVVASRDVSETGVGTTKQKILYDFDNGTISSARYKKQIEPANEADIDPRGILDVPVRTWTDASTDSQSFGFIAEEVQEAIGDMAVRHKRLTEEEADRAGETYLEEYDVEAGNEVPNSLVQMVLLGCTVSVLQDQQEQIDTLQDENERLRERNAALVSRLESIDSHLGLADEQGVADD